MSRDVRTRVHQKAHDTCIKMRYDAGPDAPNAMMQHTHTTLAPPSKHSATRNPGLKCRQPRVERAGCWVLCAGVGSGGGGACIWRQRRQPGEHRPCVCVCGCMAAHCSNIQCTVPGNAQTGPAASVYSTRNGHATRVARRMNTHTHTHTLLSIAQRTA